MHADGLTETEAGDDPLALFTRWYDEAQRVEGGDPTAMALATATPDGHASVRMVLLKGFDAHGFVFYTNYGSRKAHDLDANPRASLLFFWRDLERQVRVEGVVERVGAAESDAYFQTRPFESRVSVYASRQSEPVESREALDVLFAEAAQRFDSGAVPRPAWWGGYRVIPHVMEFWQGRVHRMHDRLRYTRQDDGAWMRERLGP
ncbi:MAG: pyridoxamine 5'-phosphate oxidase [Acidimicrobiia bacterium]|nr:pyridoxamine 5'-phosphate oxidase [Acidimicrobiia bacterium]